MATIPVTKNTFALAYKIGMSSRFKADGTRLPITILQLSDMRKRPGHTPTNKLNNFQPEVHRQFTAIFPEGSKVKVQGTTKGKGFAGGMKRHGFSGQPASHGNSKTHRAMGSAGQSQGGGSRVLPGKRMAGRMGGQNCTVKGLEILEYKGDTGTVILTGAVPGPNNGLIRIMQNKCKWEYPPVEEQELKAE